MAYVCLCVYYGQTSKMVKLVFLVCFTTEVIYIVSWALDLPTASETSPGDEVMNFENFSRLAYLQF